MITYGLTGGVGMGKTAVSDVLRERGTAVVDSDQLAYQFVEPGQPALEEIHRLFGRDVIGKDGRLNRKELARRVFTEPAARRELEAILHPRIRAAWQAQIQAWRDEGRAVAVAVVPLLYETKAESSLDLSICVACTAATQRQRLQQRGWDEQQIRQRLAAQWPVEEKIALADYVVWTEGSLELLGPQLERIAPLIESGASHPEA